MARIGTETENENQIMELAPVLNSPTIRDAATVQSENAEVPVALMVKQHENSTYLFAVGMRDGATMATFTIRETRGRRIEVLDENRVIAIKNGSFSDHFDPWLNQSLLKSAATAVGPTPQPRASRVGWRRPRIRAS